MEKLYLNDLLNLEKEEIENTKIKFNVNNGVIEPMDLYISDPEKINHDWLFWRSERETFRVGQTAICFFRLSEETWLLTTIKTVTKKLGNKAKEINYEGEEIEKYKKYFGRVIVKFKNTDRNNCRYYSGIMDKLEVLQILPEGFDGEEFPGYQNVRLSYLQLANIIDRHKTSWINALKNQKAVYLITDKKTGKLYVGSATSGKKMLLTRWMDYVKDGCGDNVEICKLKKEKTFEYIKENFQYSILENYNERVDDSIILTRESWWKETLQSRKFGYNAN